MTNERPIENYDKFEMKSKIDFWNNYKENDKGNKKK